RTRARTRWGTFRRASRTCRASRSERAAALMTKHIGRREFLRYGAIGGAIGMAARGAGKWRVEAAAKPGRAAPSPGALAEATIDGLQEQMKAGGLTARRLTQAYLDRIEAPDRKGPPPRRRPETDPDAPAVPDGLH